MQKTLNAKHCYILFSESTIGIHRVKDMQEEYIVLSGTFIPTFSALSGWSFKGRIVQDALDHKEIYESRGYKVYFLVGYDLDENGEFMATVLRNALLDAGVEKNSVFRTPLTENGYISICDFLNIEKYIKYRSHDVQFQNEVFHTLKKRIGILKTMGLLFLRKHSGREMHITRKGNSTATVVYKNLTQNKGVAI